MYGGNSGGIFAFRYRHCSDTEKHGQGSFRHREGPFTFDATGHRRQPLRLGGVGTHRMPGKHTGVVRRTWWRRRSRDTITMIE